MINEREENSEKDKPLQSSAKKEVVKRAFLARGTGKAGGIGVAAA